MKYLVVSDSHGYNGNLIKVIQKVSPVEAMFHLGDSQCSPETLEEMAKCSVYVVSGNSDYKTDIEREKVLMIEGHRIAMCHGHRMPFIKFGDFEELIQWGQEQEADVVMFGHTHTPMLKYEKNMAILNPGSISAPRQEPALPTYMIMEIDQNGEIHFTLNEFLH